MAGQKGVDFLHEQGYFTLNPGCFDLQSWEFKSLQKLCLKLNVKSAGTRDDRSSFARRNSRSRFNGCIFGVRLPVSWLMVHMTQRWQPLFTLNSTGFVVSAVPLGSTSIALIQSSSKGMWDSRIIFGRNRPMSSIVFGGKHSCKYSKDFVNVTKY